MLKMQSEVLSKKSKYDMAESSQLTSHKKQIEQDVSSDMPLTSSVVKGSTEDMRHSYKNELSCPPSLDLSNPI